MRFSLEAGAEFSNWKLLLSRWVALCYRLVEIDGGHNCSLSSTLNRIEGSSGIRAARGDGYEGIIDTIVQLPPFKTSVVIRMASDAIGFH